jgi:DNA-binding NarL/FixJ family response regulator
VSTAIPRKRVFLIEDDPVVRGRIAANIESQSDLMLAGSATTLAEATSWLASFEPDVVLCDLGLPDGSGVDAIRSCLARYPRCLVMVITVFSDDEHAFQSLEAGATGYLLKESSSDEVAGEIRALLAGGSPISPQIARRVLQRMLRSSAALPREDASEEVDTGELSPREVEVLKLLSKGFSNGEVAKLFNLSAHTVSTYVRRIYRKLAVHSRAEALFEAHQMGLLGSGADRRGP